MPNARQLRAARIAQHIASSGDYDPDCVSLMFQQADDEVKQILTETAEVNAIEKTFGAPPQPKGLRLVYSKYQQSPERPDSEKQQSR